jgi:MYXO-CTERM domain-containing protein
MAAHTLSAHVILATAVALSAATVTLSFSHDARAESPLRKGPYLTALSDSAVDVRFELGAPSTARVEIAPWRGASESGGEGRGRDAAQGSAAHSFDDHSAGAFHVVHVGGLDAGATYSYSVRVGSSASSALAAGRFTTAPRPASGAPVKFLVFGDDRTDPVAHQAVVRALSGTPSDFLVNTGDLVEDGGKADDWQTFFDTEAPLLRDRPLFVAIGNHELYDDAAGANFARYFGFAQGRADTADGMRPYGTVRLSNVRFFFLNGVDDWDTGDERQWLSRELGRADAEEGLVWRVAVVHQGPWSAGPHGGNTRLLAARIPDLLAAHKVDVVLSGHDHIYERGESGPLKYVISGGGGAPLYPIAQPVATTLKAESAYHFVEVTTASDSMRFVARRVDGSLLESCTLSKERPWACDPAPASLKAAAPREPVPPAPAPAPAPAIANPAPASGASRGPCGCAVPGASSVAGARLAASAVGLLALLALVALVRGRRRRS